MQTFPAHQAKARFGKFLDTARREPVKIEKHGRAVAVILSKEECDEIESLRLEHLRSEVCIGLDASAAGDVVEIDERDLEQFVERIMSADISEVAASR